jgi:hypothetical protein
MIDSIIKAYINFVKHGIRNSAILGATIALVMTIVVSLIMGLPIWSITALIIIGGFTVLSAAVGALVALLFIKVILPQMGINYSMLEMPTNNRLHPEKKTETGIDYELTADDLIQFLQYNYDHSPRRLYIRKLWKRSLIFIIFVVLLAAIVILVLFGKEFLVTILTLCGVALLTFLSLIISPLFLRKVFKRIVIRPYSKEKDKLVGKHKISISANAITDITDTGESNTHWDTVEYVATTDEHLFIAVDFSKPYIVPRKAFKDKSEFQQFVQTAQSYYQVAKAKR